MQRIAHSTHKRQPFSNADHYFIHWVFKIESKDYRYVSRTHDNVNFINYNSTYTHNPHSIVLKCYLYTFISLLLSPATLTRSTGKPDNFNNSKSSASTHSTAANIDCGAELEYSRNDQGTRMLELTSSTGDGTRIGNEYETPSSVAATAFTGETVNAADEPVYSDIQWRASYNT